MSPEQSKERITVNIPEARFDAVKAIADRRGISITRLVLTALEREEGLDAIATSGVNPRVQTGENEYLVFPDLYGIAKSAAQQREPQGPTE